MSIWLEAYVLLNTEKLDPCKNPISSIKQVFKKYGLDFNKPYCEASIKRQDISTIKISICNPDGLTDCVHNSFKQLVKQYPFIQCVRIDRHYYS